MQGFVKKIYWKPLIVSLIVSLGTGILSALLTRNSMDVYSTIETPALAPPGYIFPVVWTVLYIMMGLASYLVYISDSQERRTALAMYALQLALNLIWSPVFFNARSYLGAFILLVVLWAAILITTVLFFRISKPAGWLMLPYLLWVTFAGYLNYAIYSLNS